jgi:hypothetical protein
LKREKFYSAAVLIAAAVLLIVFYFFDPEGFTYYPPCYFRSVTGYYCPGCGGMRGTHLLLHGHIIDAIKHNLLIFIFIPVFAYYVFTRFVHLVFNKKLPFFNPSITLVIIAAILIIIYGILRNLPYPPFDFLLP